MLMVTFPSLPEDEQQTTAGYPCSKMNEKGRVLLSTYKNTIKIKRFCKKCPDFGKKFPNVSGIALIFVATSRIERRAHASYESEVRG